MAFTVLLPSAAFLYFGSFNKLIISDFNFLGLFSISGSPNFLDKASIIGSVSVLLTASTSLSTIASAFIDFPCLN